MFGMSFSEILIIAIIAIIVLGPEKLPSAMVQIAKFLKIFKNNINELKTSVEQEIQIKELKEDAKNFMKENENIRKKLSFEELDEIKFKNKTKDSNNV